MNDKLPINIKDLLSRRTIEYERIEFKESWNPEAVLHTLCAFANDFHNLGGGYVVIGVAEKDGLPQLPPKGLQPEQIDKIHRELLQLEKHDIVPAFHTLTATYNIQDKLILVLWAVGGEMRPYRAKKSLTEGRSTGIPTILREMAKNGSPEAVFETDNDRSYFLIRLPVHIGMQSLEQDTDLDKNTVGELLFKLLSLLKEGEKGISQLMDELAIQHKRHFRTSYIAPAIQQGLVEMTQPDKPTSRNQEYRLTALGKKYLK